MKKIAYQTPEVKVKTLFMESLMAGSGNSVTGTGAVDVGSGDWDDNGEQDPEAKNFGGNSVWDD